MTDVVAAVGAVTAALVTGLFAVLTSVMRRENNQAHADNTVMLRSIDERTQRLDERTYEHGMLMTRHADLHAGNE